MQLRKLHSNQLDQNGKQQSKKKKKSSEPSNLGNNHGRKEGRKEGRKQLSDCMFPIPTNHTHHPEQLHSMEKEMQHNLPKLHSCVWQPCACMQVLAIFDLVLACFSSESCIYWKTPARVLWTHVKLITSNEVVCKWHACLQDHIEQSECKFRRCLCDMETDYIVDFQNKWNLCLNISTIDQC